jgi:predicted negative regulator of RcsB-dependent stress response
VPGAAKVDIIPQEAFGATPRGVVGALEEFKKTMTADFTADYRGEFFLANRYLHRYRFSAVTKNLNSVQCDWDFGDGQTATGNVVEHVFLDGGTFPIRCTFKIGANSDSQTTKFIVTRNYDRITNPQTDDANDQAKFVARYDFAKLPADQLAQAVLLLVQSEDAENALRAARALAIGKNHTSRSSAFDSLKAVEKLALTSKRADDLAKLWDSVPTDSDLNPTIACEAADFFLWQQADFDHALALLTPLKSNRDEPLQSRYGQALLLAQKPEEARKVFESMPAAREPVKQAAISGASARTIEFFIRDGDVESGEDAWEQWQSHSPAEFLEGYSVLLRIKLMELRKRDTQAARVAEAFADSVPTSSYSPKLLDEASKLLKTSDAAKSAALRELLKKRYPEDPLSQ